MANRCEIVKKTSKVQGLPTVDALKASLKATTAKSSYQLIHSLFDTDTFVETSAYMKRSYCSYAETDKTAEYEGVITGYGAIDGNLVFCFVQDEDRMKGAIDENHAKKIEALYRLAMAKEAPVIGVFNSTGACIGDGISSLAAYGKILRCVTDAADTIPQIAYIMGNCSGTAVGIASAFDFVLANQDAKFYVFNPEIGGAKVDNHAVAYVGSHQDCIAYIQNLIGFLPISREGEAELTDDLNRQLGDLNWGGDAKVLLSHLCDNGQYLPLYDTDDAVNVCFSTIGGVKCGIVAISHQISEGKITQNGAKKIAEFISICEGYDLPVVTLNDSAGMDIHMDMASLRDLAFAYAGISSPAVTVILKHAIGAAFVLLGSKAVGADLVYALENAEIGALPASGSVAFAWNDQITTDLSREELETKWKETVSTPVAAASTGEIDDIISTDELRCRIASALLMLSC